MLPSLRRLGPHGGVRRRSSLRICSCFLLLLLPTANRASAQLDFEAEPINYNTAPVNDPVEKLRQKVERGDVKLAYDDRYGYLTGRRIIRASRPNGVSSRPRRSLLITCCSPMSLS